MDNRLMDYIVLKTVEVLDGRQKKSASLRKIIDIQRIRRARTFDDFGLSGLWKIFHSIPVEDIQQTIAALNHRGYLCIKDARHNENMYSIISISKKGSEYLDELELTEGKKINASNQNLKEYSNVTYLGNKSCIHEYDLLYDRGCTYKSKVS